jgi:DNA-directed RNA polymerase specialized sigma24 family protein
LREIAVLFDCSAEAVRKRLKTQKLTLKKRRLPIQKKTKNKEQSTLKR